MTYVTLVAACFACNRTFTCNPHRVPSYQNQPICRTCIEKANKVRAEKGLPQWPVPEDAYDVAEW